MHEHFLCLATLGPTTHIATSKGPHRLGVADTRKVVLNSCCTLTKPLHHGGIGFWFCRTWRAFRVGTIGCQHEVKPTLHFAHMENEVAHAPTRATCYWLCKTTGLCCRNKARIFCSERCQIVGTSELFVAHYELLQESREFTPPCHWQFKWVVSENLHTYVVCASVVMLFNSRSNFVERSPCDNFVNKFV